MGIFIYCYTATGKSTLGKKYSNVIDMESTLYKYGLQVENEKIKGTNRNLNEEYPNNYFKALFDVKDKYDYILISDYICNDWLIENGFEYWQIYPNKELKEEYLKRMESRGNIKDFIDYQSKMWDEWIDGCANDENATKHIELQQGQHLEDVLPNLVLKEKYDRIY